MAKKKHIKNKLRLLIVVVCILVAVTIGVSLLVETHRSSPYAKQQSKEISAISPTIAQTTSWKVFTAPTEGFSLKYPSNWIIENSSNGNCGHTALSGSNCRDRYEFVAPDGVRVRYVIYTDVNDDKIGCGPGTGAACWSQNVVGLEKMNVPNLGQVYLVKLDKDIGALNNRITALDMPLSQETTPVVGKNNHYNFDIDFSMPSKTGGRYSLFITTSSPDQNPLHLGNMSTDQFYNLPSVKQAILILKSISY